MKKTQRGIHLGIIPDGSRRWAKRNGIDNYEGRQSGETVERILKHVFSKHDEVTEISVWALSTENLKRKESDKELVYNILRNTLKSLRELANNEKKPIKVRAIGSRWNEFPKDLSEQIREVVESTKDNEGAILNLCIGYGGRQEILDAVMASSMWLRKNPTIASIHENVFEKFLLIPRPLDLVIRTGGEKRLSGFMLYQMEYAELFFTDTLWPAFTTKELDKILDEFNRRDRRYGK